MDERLGYLFSPWLWWTWALLLPLAIRMAVVQCTFARWCNAAYDIAYAVWVGAFAAAIGFVTWTGMQPYGFHNGNPWHVAGSLVLSFIALPILFGAPVVLIGDVIWYRIARMRRSRRNDQFSPRTN